VIDIVSVAEMGAHDAAALEETSHDELVRRAGHAVAHRAIELLEGASGRHIVVLAGSGSNGADGRVAAALLRRRGAAVRVLGPSARSEDLAGAELVIDAAFGTGLSRPYEAPVPPEGALVLAVDLPSGLDGDTGAVRGAPMRADATVTMAAPKVGLLLGDGPELAGEVTVADIGIATPGATMALVEDADLDALPRREASAHKWSAAVVMLAGSAGMEGAAALSALGALAAGAGMVRLVSNGSVARIPIEVVVHGAGPTDMAATVLAEARRAGALVVGPGLGADPTMAAAVRRVLEERTAPVVLDADGLGAVGDLDELARLVAARPHPVVVTPHDGELARLVGAPLSADRLAQLRDVVATTGATLLSKGPTTVVVAPGHEEPTVLLVDAGTPALATAGTGDVLSGVIGALLAQGMTAPAAAALGAHLHGRAGARARGTLVASMLPGLVGELLWEVERGG
jgi:NAD(P)H-hydrate epimerase